MTIDSIDDAPEYVRVLAQDVIADIPVVILGSGASIPHGLPSMGSLANSLKVALADADLCVNDSEIRRQFAERLDSHGDLERALSEVSVSDRVLQLIVQSTWSIINRHDMDVFSRACLGHETLPLAHLLDYLFQSNARVIHVVTTNYDRVLEYSAECARVHHDCGFSYGIMRHHLSSGYTLYERRQGAGGLTPTRTVRALKVHGSIDWFYDEASNVIGLPLGYKHPERLIPAIITPGVTKFEAAHNEPFRSIIQLSDQTIREAKSLMCVGFGFNDRHIQPEIIKRTREPRCKFLIMARHLTNNARSILQEIRCAQYLALEEHEGGTMAYCPRYPGGVPLSGMSIWNLSDFVREVLPGVKPCG